MSKNLVIRCDAGRKFGLGHLSRCISLAEEFESFYSINFIIKTDDRNKVEGFIANSSLSGVLQKTIFLHENVSHESDIRCISSLCQSRNSFLILDHYSIDKKYQEKLKANEIKWLQFDSHAKIEFLADLVLHASPAASFKKYAPLKANPKTKFLLGTRYAIVNKKFRNKRNDIKVRETLKNLLICFGGGDDKGATLTVVKNLDNQFIGEIQVQIIITNSNIQLDEIKKEVAQKDNLKLIINTKQMQEYMANADLGIIAPGTLSYEAACLGLPMVLIPFADNQLMNAKGWVDINCAESPGSIEHVDIQSLRKVINKIEIGELSTNCLKSVDGNGAKRTAEEIKKIFN